MANIREYTNPTNGIRPSETGADAWARAGMRISEMGHQAGQAVAEGGRQIASGVESIEKFQASHEISQGWASGSAVLADGTQEWNDALGHADPNDIGATRQKFLEGLDEKLAKFTGGFTTEKGKLWAEEHAANLRSHFNQKTIADVSTAAGHALQVNVEQGLNNLTVAVQNDPTTLDTALATVKPTVDALVDNAHELSGTDAMTARTTLVQDQSRRLVTAAARAAIDRDPQRGLAMLEGKYGDLLPPETITTLRERAEAVTRAKRADATAATVERMRAEQRASDVRANEMLASWAKPGPDGKPGPVGLPEGTRQSILTDPALKPSEKGFLWGMADRVERDLNKYDTAHNDPHVTADLMQRIGDPARPTTREEITEAVKAGNLTPQMGMELFAKTSGDLSSQMRQLTSNDLVRAEMDRAAAAIAGPNLLAAIGGTNQAVRAKIDSFKVDTLRRLQDAVAKNENPQKFLDPKSPDYLFSPQRVEQYRPTKEELRNQLLSTQREQAQDRKASTDAPPNFFNRLLSPSRPARDHSDE